MIRKLRTARDDRQCPLEDAVEACEDLEVPEKMWVFENQYHPLWGTQNLGGLDGHDYVFDWLHDVFWGKGIGRRHNRVADVRENGDGPWGKCEWTLPVRPGQAYF